MNHEQTEGAYTTSNKRNIRIACLFVLGGFFFLLLLPILVTLISTAINRLKWNNAQISNYTITIVDIGPAGMSPQTVTVRNGKIAKSSIRIVQDGKVQEFPSIPALDLTIDDLFYQAYGCFIYRLCSVQFDDQYGYPTRIGGGFIEPSGIEVIDFQPN